MFYAEQETQNHGRQSFDSHLHITVVREDIVF